jgi:hypothetical protein
LIVELGTSTSLTNGSIDSWDAFCHALQERFYSPGYLQNIIAKWLQLCQLATHSVQGYIDVFDKLHIQLHINELDEVLIIKFNYGLLLPLRQEVDLFDSSSLDKAFLRALVIERKVSPQTRYSPNQTQSANPHNSQPQP